MSSSVRKSFTNDNGSFGRFSCTFWPGRAVKSNEFVSRVSNPISTGCQTKSLLPRAGGVEGGGICWVAEAGGDGRRDDDVVGGVDRVTCCAAGIFSCG